MNTPCLFVSWRLCVSNERNVPSGQIIPMSWTEADNCLTRTFTFPDFNAAFGFMTRVALVAEKMDHHPEWTNVYNRVDVRLRTHSAGNTVTRKDRDLAAAMDRIAGEQG